MVKAQKTFRHDKSSIHNHHQEDFAAFNEADSSGALCVIFSILVSFSRDNALFASKAKIKVFEIFFEERAK